MALEFLLCPRSGIHVSYLLWGVGILVAHAYTLEVSIRLFISGIAAFFGLGFFISTGALGYSSFFFISSSCFSWVDGVWGEKGVLKGMNDAVVRIGVYVIRGVHGW